MHAHAVIGLRSEHVRSAGVRLQAGRVCGAAWNAMTECCSVYRAVCHHECVCFVYERLCTGAAMMECRFACRSDCSACRAQLHMGAQFAKSMKVEQHKGMSVPSR
eukprot:838565-Pelagomonas_calceolata.AAC.2